MSSRNPSRERSDFDERGWALDVAASLGPSWLVFAPAEVVALDSHALAHQAARLGGSVRVLPTKHYPSGALPRADAATLTVTFGPLSGQVVARALPIERVQGAVRRGLLAAEAAPGMDVLVRRARTLIQIDDTDGPAPLIAALFFSAHTLGPILAPDAGALFAIKGARERLADLAGTR